MPLLDAGYVGTSMPLASFSTAMSGSKCSMASINSAELLSDSRLHIAVVDIDTTRFDDLYTTLKKQHRRCKSLDVGKSKTVATPEKDTHKKNSSSLQRSKSVVARSCSNLIFDHPKEKQPPLPPKSQSYQALQREVIADVPVSAHLTRSRSVDQRRAHQDVIAEQPFLKRDNLFVRNNDCRKQESFEHVINCAFCGAKNQLVYTPGHTLTKGSRCKNCRKGLLKMEVISQHEIWEVEFKLPSPPSIRIFDNQGCCVTNKGTNSKMITHEEILLCHIKSISLESQSLAFTLGTYLSGLFLCSPGPCVVVSYQTLDGKVRTRNLFLSSAKKIAYLRSIHESATSFYSEFLCQGPTSILPKASVSLQEGRAIDVVTDLIDGQGPNMTEGIEFFDRGVVRHSSAGRSVSYFDTQL